MPPPASPSNGTFEIGAPVLVLRQSLEVEDKDKGAAGSTSCGDDCSWEPAIASGPARDGSDKALPENIFDIAEEIMPDAELGATMVEMKPWVFGSLL